MCSLLLQWGFTSTETIRFIKDVCRGVGVEGGVVRNEMSAPPP